MMALDVERLENETYLGGTALLAHLGTLSALCRGEINTLFVHTSYNVRHDIIEPTYIPVFNETAPDQGVCYLP